ncbi:MAG: TatD family hydrolase [Endomicrobium sp.]|jgi:TatD DNase family protein|nr:TatD family hydrolase [Endomicrobium sp.]
MIIDTHAHLLDAKFDADRQTVIQRAFDAGVRAIFEIACEPKDWDAALEFSKNDFIYTALGIHPLEVKNYQAKDLARLETLLTSPKCIAVGEIGLDYHYIDHSSKLEKLDQLDLFASQIAISKKLKKPAIIHCRDAYQDMLDLLDSFAEYGVSGVIHCFSGNTCEAEKFLEMGFLLGIDGPLTYKNSNALRDVVFKTDISKLLIETDCPYLPPQKYRGQRNEPSYITETLEAVAKIKKLSVEETVRITSENAKKLFAI